jgi:hypothetical protein
MDCLATAPDPPDEPIVTPSPDLSSSDRAGSGPEESAIVDLPLWYAAILATVHRAGSATQKPHSGRFWRAIVARWPLDRRQRWGDRANELQDAGFGWKEAESVAFEEITDDARPTASRSLRADLQIRSMAGMTSHRGAS